MAKQELIRAEDYDDRMESLSKGEKAVRIPRQLNRAEVVATFLESFEQIGGVPRMALWADEHPTEFYRLYAKLLPSQATAQIGDKDEMVIRHVLPRSALDD